MAGTMASFRNRCSRSHIGSGGDRGKGRWGPLPKLPPQNQAGRDPKS